jgi:glycosyltransferase involved in cell wall biosynthesis
MVKVLHVISDTGIGGAGVLLCNLLSCLDRKRFEVTVVVPKGSMLVPRIRSLEIAVIEIPHGADRSADFRAITALFCIVRAERPHIIHTHSALYARLAGWFCRVPISVNTRHCAYMNEPSSPISRLTTYSFERMIGSHTIATADYVKEVLLTRGVPSNAIHIIHNGSPPCRKLTEKEKNDVRRNLGLSESNFIVGMVARLEAGKGHETLLRAARICIEKTPSIRFVIVGDGSRSEKLRKLAHDLGLEKHVIFTGFCSDVAPFMNILHLNVNCSEQSETSSLSLSEGMSVGAVPVVSNCGGNSYMAGFGESGMIFPIGDAAALANIILALEKNRIGLEELSRKCIERFQQHLTATEMTRQVEALYDRLLQTL